MKFIPVLFLLVAFLSLISLCSSYARPYSTFTDWEFSLHTYRRKHNIPFDYNPRHITHEDCRFLTEANCRAQDAAIGEHQRIMDKKQTRSMNEKSSASASSSRTTQRRRTNVSRLDGNFKVLVLLIRFQDHADRKLPTREYFDELFNGGGTGIVNTIGPIREYLYYSSLGKYNGMCVLFLFCFVFDCLRACVRACILGCTMHACIHANLIRIVRWQ
jgi:hypothetical protein